MKLYLFSSKIIKQSFHGAWKSWTKIPKEVRNMWFKEFEKEYCWHDEDNMEIKKIFEHRGSIILKNKLHRAHKDNQRAEWIGENAWNDLLEKWQEENFQKISTQNKANRASDCGGRGFPLHQGGSISYLAHKDKLEKELGHTPGLAETFMRTHSSLNDKGERAWVDDCAKNTYNMFKEKWDALSSQSSNEGGEESQQNMLSELQVWVETVGGVKKGRCYGVAGEASFLKGPSSSQGSSAQYAKHQELEKEIDSLRIANEKLTEKMEKMASDFESHVQSFHQMFQSMQHFTAHAPYRPHAPYHPVPLQSPHPLGPGNQSQYYPPSSFGFMPPSYLSRPEVTQNVPSSSKSHNQNEQENDDSDQEDEV